MAVMRVNPTRMELTRLKKKMQVARRGYKLLKDKRDELMKKFLELASRNKELREKVEGMLESYYQGFLKVSSAMDPEFLEEALMLSRQEVLLAISTKNVMSVEVPEFAFEKPDAAAAEIHSYGFAFTSAELDTSADFLSGMLPLMIELAQVEKSVHLLSNEIEKTRRRVNALEHVLIPQLEETIKYITMKLEENERGNLTRLMKVKDMMLERVKREKVF